MGEDQDPCSVSIHVASALACEATHRRRAGARPQARSRGRFYVRVRSKCGVYSISIYHRATTSSADLHWRCDCLPGEGDWVGPGRRTAKALAPLIAFWPLDARPSTKLLPESRRPKIIREDSALCVIPPIRLGFSALGDELCHLATAAGSTRVDTILLGQNFGTRSRV